MTQEANRTIAAGWVRLTVVPFVLLITASGAYLVWTGRPGWGWTFLAAGVLALAAMGTTLMRNHRSE